MLRWWFTAQSAVAGRVVKIIWAGPVQPPAAMLASNAPHPATMRWQRTFLDGLREAGADVRWIGHSPHRTWPWGPLCVPATPVESLAGFDCQARDVSYLNIVRYRDASLRRAYRKAIATQIAVQRPDVIVSYNTDPSMQGAADVAVAAGIPWAPIVLDFVDPRRDNWRMFKEATARAAGVAFVSDWAARHAPVAQLHLIKGAVSRRTPQASRPSPEVRTIVFSGSRTRATGIDRLLAALPVMRSRRVRLVMTGHGRNDFPRSNPPPPGIEVVDMGMLPEAELERIAEAATVLVNPRPVDSDDSCMNFPSKVLDYLSYERPIVSTRALGIGPEYDAVLVFAETDSPASLAAAIDEVLEWTPECYAEAVSRIRTFNASSTPEASAACFIEWLATVCRTCRSSA
jgi:glycosyltransferase involved in cell wall biosynthesis